MARAGTKPKKDNLAENCAKIFSASTLAAFEEAKKLAKSPKAKRFSSAKKLLEDCK